MGSPEFGGDAQVTTSLPQNKFTDKICDPGTAFGIGYKGQVPFAFSTDFAIA